MSNISGSDTISLRQPVNVNGRLTVKLPAFNTLVASALAAVGNNPTGIFVLDNYAYVVNKNDSTLSVIDTNTGQVVSNTSLTASSQPNAVFVDGMVAYITHLGANIVSIVDVSLPLEPSIIMALTTSAPTSGVFVSGHIAYVTLATGGLITIDITDPYASMVVDSISFGHQSAGVIPYPIAGGMYAFVADTTDNAVYLIEATDPTNIGAGGPSITVGSGPTAVDIADGFLYVTNSGSNTVSVIFIDALAVTSTFTVGNGPNNVQACGDYVFVNNVTDSTLGIINSSTSSYLGAIALPASASGMFVCGNEIYFTLSTNDVVSLQLTGLITTSIQSNSADIGTLLVRNQAVFNDDVQIGRGLSVGFPGLWVNGPISANSNLKVQGNLLLSGTADCVYENVSNSLSIGTSTTNFPLVISGQNGSSNGYGTIQMLVSSNSSETGLELDNTSDGGRNYVLLSAGSSSAAGVGNFVIGDATAGASRVTIVSSGDVGIGTSSPNHLLDVNGAFHSITSLSTINAVTYSDVPTIDCTLGDIHTITLTGDASPSFTNVQAGQVVMFIVTQDSSGGHAITWSGNVVGNPPPLILTANAVTTFEFVGTADGNLNPVNNASSQIAAGSNITLTPSGNIITIAASVPNTTPTVQSVGPGGSVTVDLSQGSVVHVSMNGDISIDATNMVQGQSYTFLVTQANGNVVTWSSAFVGGMTIGFGTNDSAHTTAVQQFVCPDGSKLVSVTTGIGDLAWP